MSPKILTCITAMTVFAMPAIPARLAAQDQQEHDKRQARYTVINLGTLGGTESGANGINNKGWVTGYSNLQGDQSEHAVLWRKGEITDLGTLGGPTSVAWPLKDDQGLITGFADTANIDPFDENFCSPTCTPGVNCQGSNLTCRGFLWRNGTMTNLATLGGNNSYATDINKWGQVVGTAENATQDPNCVAPQVLDFETVIWGPKAGEIQELHPFPGATVGGAFAINDKSQVVGGSGTCGTPSPAICVHAVLWENGSVTNLGSFGGVMNNAAFGINNQGQVVGLSDLTGDNTAHAFLWQNGVMTDLGTLPGDVFSIAQGINDAGQVVGQSCDASGNCRAFLWENGGMTDLNSLIPPGSSLYLLGANDINSQGEIVGVAFDQDTGATPAFSATPNYEDNNEAAFSATQIGTDAPKVILPENVRKLLQQRRGFGRSGGPTRPQ